MAGEEGDEPRDEEQAPAAPESGSNQAAAIAAVLHNLQPGVQYDGQQATPLGLVEHAELQHLNDPEVQAQVQAVQHAAHQNFTPQITNQDISEAVPAPGSVAHAVAVSNAALWIEVVYGPKIVVEQQHITFTGLSLEQHAEKEAHYRLMGLITEAEKTEWLQNSLTTLVRKKRLEAQRLSALSLISGISGKSGSKYKLAAEKWHLEGLPKKPITVNDLRGDKRDFQGLNWIEMTGLTTAKGREKRLDSYEILDQNNKPKPEPRIEAARYDEWSKSNVPESANFMQFRRFDFFMWKSTGPLVLKPAHRNALVVGPGSSVFCTNGGSSVLCKEVHPDSSVIKQVIKLKYPDGVGNDKEYVNINAIAAKYGVLVAGARFGEFGIRSTLCNVTDEKFQVTGYIKSPRPPAPWRRPGVGHIDIVKSHRSGLTQAIMSSRDGNIYTLDCTTGKLIGEGTRYSNVALRCSAQSPDNRLRVIVGDSSKVKIAEADGQRKVLHKLTGHFDSVAACAWSDNGIHIATAGFDKLVRIWDARMLTDGDGSGRTLTTTAAKMSPVRGLEFSPIGSGRRCLMMREEADIVSFLDARTFEEKQSIEVLGQLTGGGWSGDGQRVVVGVQDDLVGGMLTLDRCGWGQGDEYTQQDSAPPKPTSSEDSFRSKDWRDSLKDGKSHGSLAVETTKVAAAVIASRKKNHVHWREEYRGMEALNLDDEVLGEPRGEDIVVKLGHEEFDESDSGDEDEDIGIEEQYRNRSSTYWKRKAAGAGDFSDLL